MQGNVLPKAHVEATPPRVIVENFTPTFLGGAQSSGGGLVIEKYADGLRRITGEIRSGSAPEIFTMPEGYEQKESEYALGHAMAAGCFAYCFVRRGTRIACVSSGTKVGDRTPANEVMYVTLQWYEK